jgi:carboxymethylenebutenolidase
MRDERTVKEYFDGLTKVSIPPPAGCFLQIRCPFGLLAVCTPRSARPVPVAFPPESNGASRRLARRDLLKGGLLAGFALAAGPLAASTITTPERGLDAGWISISAADGSIRAYRARPAGAKQRATVLLVQEIFGVHTHIQDDCRRLARLGYLAIAPDLFERQGDVSRLPDIPSILPVVARVPDAQVMAGLDATVAWAAASGEGDPARLAITGFCWGGRITWLDATHNPRLRAGVAWYGRWPPQGPCPGALWRQGRRDPARER